MKNNSSTSPSLLGLTAHILKVFRNIAKFEGIGYFICSIAQTASELIQVYLLAQMVGAITNYFSGAGDFSKVIQLFILYMLAELTVRLSWTLMGYLEKGGYLSWSKYSYISFVTKIGSLSIEQHENSDIRNRINHIEQEGYPWKPGNFAFDILYVIHALARGAGALIALAFLSPIIAIVIFSGSVPNLILQKKDGEKGWGIWGIIGDSSRMFWGIARLLQTRGSIEEIKPQQSLKFLLGKASIPIDEYVKEQKKHRDKFVWLQIGAKLISFSSIFISLGYLILQVQDKAIDIAGFTFFSGMIWQAASSTELIFQSIGRLLEDAPVNKEILQILNLKTERTEETVHLPANQPLHITFENVSYYYKNTDTPAISSLNLSIMPGDHIAIVGANGSGKTTLIKLLLGLYKPSEGMITVNDTDLEKIKKESYYSQIGTLFQIFNRYPLHFVDNINTSQKSLDVNRFRKSLAISKADSVLKSLKGNDKIYLDPSFEKGVDLSGGQWQRVAIARNVYLSGNVIILDEPTSAIDANSEAEIFESLYKELGGKTIITVSHRFNTVRKADRIIVLQEGKIIQEGTHNQLIKKSGPYKTMFEKQAEGYK